MLRQLKYHVGDFMPALRSRNYRLYFVGQGISLIGTWMATVAEQWLIYPVLTNNKSLLGIVSAINLIPTAILVLLAGVLADRIDKRQGIIVQHLLYASVAFIMFLLVFTGRVQVWHVMLSAFAMGIIFAFDMPTRQALMVSLVEKRDFASALSLNSGIFNVARAIGPAVAGLLIATAGIAPAYFFNSLSFLAVVVSVILMQLPHPTSDLISTPLRESFLEGVRYIRMNKVIGVMLALLGILTISTWPAATILPVFAHDIYQRGEVGFGLLQSFFGLGAMVGAFGFASLYGRIIDKYRLLLILLTTIAVAYSVFSLAPIFMVALLAQFASGLSVVMLIALLNTLIQTATPDVLRGRMLSFYSFVLIGGMPIGALFASVGVGLLGPRYLVFAGTLFFLITSTALIVATRGKLREKIVAMV